MHIKKGLTVNGGASIDAIHYQILLAIEISHHRKYQKFVL